MNGSQMCEKTPCIMHAAMLKPRERESPTFASPNDHRPHPSLNLSFYSSSAMLCRLPPPLGFPRPLL